MYALTERDPRCATDPALSARLLHRIGTELATAPLPTAAHLEVMP